MSDPQRPSEAELETCPRCGYVGGKYAFHRAGDQGDYDVCPDCGYTSQLFPNGRPGGCLGVVLVATTLSAAGAGLAFGLFFT